MRRILQRFCFLFLVFFTTLSLFAQHTVRDLAVKTTTTVQESPPQITLTWEASGFAVYTEIYRKLKHQELFPSVPLATLPLNELSYTDNNVEAGIQYDYLLVQQNDFNTSNTATLFSWGGVSAGIKLNIEPYKGKLLIVVDTLIQNTLNSMFERFKNDLTEDGWVVSVADKVAEDSVPSIKAKIRNWYNQDPLNSKALLLLGNIPVPYSGDYGQTGGTPPDAHIPDHNGAWAADVYYGIMDESAFTDIRTNESGITREANKNRPNDGKFDQSYIPSDVQLQVGRIDMSGLNAVGSDYLGRTERYLDKNHAFRNKHFEVPRRYIFEDRLGLLGGEAPGRLHYFQSSLFHKDSMIKISNDFFAQVKAKPCLWSGVTSSAGYTQINGVGNVNNFADTVYAVFSNYFGSYFVDWDNDNNFLRGAIGGPGYTLTSVWSGRPVVHFHHMALGENIGFCLRHAQQNQLLSGSMAFYPGAFQRSIHLSMHGDPTLRLHTLHPISDLYAEAISDNKQVFLSWTASAEQDIAGYSVYRSGKAEGPYHVVSHELIADTSFTDELPMKGDNHYMVKTVKLETTPSGTYYNVSQGRRTGVEDVDGVLISAKHTETLHTVTLYPNPSQGEVNIILSREGVRANGVVFDVSGKEQAGFTLETQQTTLRFNHLPAGVYFIKLQTGESVRTVKWVKI